MRRKFRCKLISCFLAVLLSILSFNTIVSNSNIVYGDTIDDGQAASTNVEVKVDSEDLLDLEEGQVDSESSKEQVEKDKYNENYSDAEENIYISPEEIVAREEKDNSLNSLQILEESQDTFIYKSFNDFESFANVSYTQDINEDVNEDGEVNEIDLDLVSSKYNLKSSDSEYTPKYDINGDGMIDLFDLTLISSKLGTGCKKVIAIDPGHGGSDPGATGVSGLKEKTVVLNIGLMVRDMLVEKGYRVVMTRTGDYRLSEDLTEDLKKRAEIANEANADLFVSIHANSYTSPTAHGTETYYHKSLSASSQSAKLASSIQTNLVNTLGRYDRKVKTADFSVLRNAKMDAALTEIAFISNPEEEKLLGSEQFQRNAAKAIVEGIIASFN